MKEEILIRRVVAGESRALREFYRIFQPKLGRFLNAKIGNPSDAEEVLADALLSAIDCLPLFSGKSKLSTWVMAIAKHELVDYYRRKKFKELIFSHFGFLKKIVDRALGPDLALEEKEAKERILVTFENISEGYAQVLRLKYMEGLSVAEIAGKLKMTIKAVESRLSRARKAFQKQFGGKRKIIPEASKIFDSSFD